MIDVQAYILFLTAAFFTALSIGVGSTRQSNKNLGVMALFAFAAVSWQIMSLVWLPLTLASTSLSPSYDVYAVAFLFQAFAIVFYVVTIMSAWDWLKIRRYGEELGED